MRADPLTHTFDKRCERRRCRPIAVMESSTTSAPNACPSSLFATSRIQRAAGVKSAGSRTRQREYPFPQHADRAIGRKHRVRGPACRVDSQSYRTLWRPCRAGEPAAIRIPRTQYVQHPRFKSDAMASSLSPPSDKEQACAFGGIKPCRRFRHDRGRTQEGDSVTLSSCHHACILRQIAEEDLGSTNGANAARRGYLRLNISCGIRPSLAAPGLACNPAAGTPRSVVDLAMYIIADRAPKRDMPCARGYRQ
jgi:hypothetical protein